MDKTPIEMITKHLEYKDAEWETCKFAMSELGKLKIKDEIHEYRKAINKLSDMQDSAIGENRLNISDAMCRNCSTCGHNNKGKCMVSGYSITNERTYPTKCGQNFEKWTPKPPKIGLKKRLLSFWYGT